MDRSRANALGSDSEQGVETPVRSISEYVGEHTREELIALLALSGIEVEYIDEVALLRVTGHNDSYSAILRSLLRKTFTDESKSS
jgi:hypothetical protein